MGNIFEYNKLNYNFKVNLDGSIEDASVFLCDKNLNINGKIANIESLKIIPNFNSFNECSFTVYKMCNGIINPLWDKIDNFAVIMINNNGNTQNKKGFGLFEITVQKTETDSVVKYVSGKSLQHQELSDCKCTLEINTENDIARDDYDEEYPTLFYRADGHNEASLLHRILTYAPHYSIGYVDTSLMNIQRTFSCSDKPVLDFLNEIATEIGCVFIFNPYKRELNAFDLTDHCLDCSNGRHVIDGVCQECGSKHIEKGYGKDISLLVDTKTIAEEVTLQAETDQVKNCFKLVAGDDEITNLIQQRLIGNSQYLWTFSQDMLNCMSDKLKAKWSDYNNLVKSYQTEFENLWETYDNALNDKLMWQSNKFPKSYTEFNSSVDVWNTIKTKITYSYITSKITVLSTLSNNILNMTKLICSSEYTVEFAKLSNGTDKVSCTTTKDGNYNIINTWTGYLHIYKNNYVDKNGNNLDEYYTPAWTLSIKKGYDNIPTANNVYSNDYYLYLKQHLDYMMGQSSITYSPKHDTDYPGNNPDKSDKFYYKNYFPEFSLAQLQSWYSAYKECSTIIFSVNSTITSDNITKQFYYVTDEKGTVSSKTIYDALKEKYKDYCDYLEILISRYTQYINSDIKTMENSLKRIHEINNICNLYNYLGEQLYMELISYKKEDTYTNSNFTSDVVDEAAKIQNVEEFISSAKEALAKAAEFQYTVNVTMGNVLSDLSYRDIFNVFRLGNYVRLRIDNKIVKLRIVSLTFDFDNIEKTDITFSEAAIIDSTDVYSKIQETISNAQSLSSGYSYTQKQSSNNNKKLSKFDDIFQNGLNTTNTLIKNAENQTVVIDEHGILTRQYYEDSDSYDKNQMRITNSTIAFTTDDWQTVKGAFGRYYFNGEWLFGVIAESIVGRQIIGKNLEIINDDNTLKMDNNGLVISKDKNSISLNADTCSFTIAYDNKQALHFDPNTGLTVTGNIKGGSININENFVVDAEGNLTAKTGKFTGTVEGATVKDGTVNIKNTFTIDENGHITALDGTVGDWKFYKDKYGNNYFEGKSENNWLRSSYKLTINSDNAMTINSQDDIQVISVKNTYLNSTENSYIAGKSVYITSDASGAIYLNGTVYINGRAYINGQEITGNIGDNGDDDNSGGDNDGGGTDGDITNLSITSITTNSVELSYTIPGNVTRASLCYGNNSDVFTNYLGGKSIKTDTGTYSETLTNFQTSFNSGQAYYFGIILTYNDGEEYKSPVVSKVASSTSDTSNKINDLVYFPDKTEYANGIATVTLECSIPNEASGKMMHVYYLESTDSTSTPSAAEILHGEKFTSTININECNAGKKTISITNLTADSYYVAVVIKDSDSVFIASSELSNIVEISLVIP